MASCIRQKVYERLRQMSKDGHDSGGIDIPLTSDSFLATFGVLVLFPMTVLWSQSTVVPLMSPAEVVCRREMEVVEVTGGL